MSTSDARRLNRAALGLAVAHLLVALGLLALSGWFIAASALAGAWGLAVQFNVMVPSALIRLLAFARVLSGYGERYVGHLGLLRRLGEVRERLFERWVLEAGSAPTAAVLERLEADADAMAGLWVRVWNPLVAAGAVMLSVGIVLHRVWPVATPVWWAGCVGLLALLAAASGIARRRAEATLAGRSAVRAEFMAWSRAAPVWSLQPRRGEPDRPLAAWRHWHAAARAEAAFIQRLEGGVQALGWLGVLTLGAWLAVRATPVRGQALLLVPVLIWVAARDWLFTVARALPELGRWPRQRARLDLDAARPDSAPMIGHAVCPGNQPVRLSLEAYRWRRPGREGRPVTLVQDGPGLILVEAGSGVGKTSLFEALLGQLPEAGRWALNHRSGRGLTPAERRAWMHLSEQFGHVFADTLGANLRLARPEADDDACCAALRWAGLDGWASPQALALWLGEPGRPVSGGEQKRLNLARAWLRDAPIWLLDEPFEGLDEALQQRLARRLRERARHRLLIVASHRVPDDLRPDRRLAL